MDEGCCHRALTNSGCNALDRTMPKVSGDKDAGLARFQRQRISGELPPPVAGHVCENILAG
jgi:hypothetical protein